MISVDARGRMGNAMFQLAFAHAASRRLQTSFVFGPAPLWEQFELGPWGRRSVRLRRKLVFRTKYGANPTDRVFIEANADPGAVMATLRDGVAYGGFFQSERYFAGYEDEIRALFTVRGEHLAEFSHRYGWLSRYVCMHVRRTDYLDQSALALPRSYFSDALAAVPGRESLDLVVVSDDPDGVRTELADLGEFHIAANPPLTDFLLLMNANVVITSNSSFSWWAAWLNTEPGVRVLVPQHWLGFARGVEVPRDVIPERWSVVPVRR